MLSAAPMHYFLNKLNFTKTVEARGKQTQKPQKQQIYENNWTGITITSSKCSDNINPYNTTLQTP